MTLPLPPFYTHPRPMQAAVDGAMSLRQPTDYRFAASVHSVPLVLGEFFAAAKSFPILFAGEAAAPVALLGLREGENLFVDAAGRWDEDAYLPAYVRRYPFILMEENGGTEFTLCLDEGADNVVAGTENPFFVDGQPTDLTVQALDFARHYQAGHVQTAAFVAALRDQDMLVQNQADIVLKSGEPRHLSGFRVIDAEKLNRLPAERLVDWRDKGWLAAAYAHLASLSDWALLINRAGR
ncbi:SapC family protein [Nitrospirillum sp. BR 11828]|uniref:SapC family protein n=1 Tax=Nitrospirillum sp. BR 11828 TaxID=3104325 RepID=UPI002ACA43DE|nr:SapC family protein [Nitrospirillum sp. BR 11828]MDZ5648300.1 SapC family protein [Nitrospirillum sp. BR 11828]